MNRSNNNKSLDKIQHLVIKISYKSQKKKEESFQMIIVIKSQVQEVASLYSNLSVDVL